MLRLLANENIPGDAVVALRAQGHDVDWVAQVLPGSDDETVLRHAAAEVRVLLTFDKDFGDLVFRRGRNASPGVVLLRLAASNPAMLAEMIVAAIGSRTDWAGAFSVIDNERIRMVPLP